MKKMLFGITLILFSIMLYILGEVEHIDIFYNDFVQMIYLVLPFIGLVFSVWGLVKKEEKTDKEE